MIKWTKHTIFRSGREWITCDVAKQMGSYYFSFNLKFTCNSFPERLLIFLLRIILKFLKSTAISKFVLYVWYTIPNVCANRDNYIKITIPMAI